MKQLIIYSILTFLTVVSVFSKTTIQHVEPMNWWVGMNNTELQILVHAEGISITTPEIDYAGVSIKEIKKVENPNYLFIYINIEKETKPAVFNIVFKNGKKKIAEHAYELKARNSKENIQQGFDASDVIYLLMPDRFANGNTENDNMPNMYEQADRKNPNGRHGGDLKGIYNKLDYLNELGVTALWLNPFLENNQPAFTYHGYAISDFYKSDARYGTNHDFVDLVDAAHAKGLKIIMDMIFNHCGINHWWMRDLPSNDWVHQYPEFTRSNFRAPTVADPYASKVDRNKMLTGWFDKNMPDLNQKNELLATYLIQNAIWWVEFAGLDGIRVDTQPYPYKEFMAKWAKALMAEYPEFNIVGEAWLQKIPISAYFQGGANNKDGYDSHMPAITDFPLYFALTQAFNETEGWATGMARLYYILAQDFEYADPNNLVIFPDNHDLSRYYETMQHDMNKYKMGLAYILITRGIPQLYYGTEILMDGFEHEGHGFIRKDFPGGWEEDEKNLFTREGRSEEQNQAFDYLSNILNWRKSKEVVHNGELTHFLPEDGVYVMFRHNDKEAVMLVLNNSEEEKELTTERFNEILKDYNTGFEVISKTNIDSLGILKLKSKSAQIIDLKR